MSAVLIGSITQLCVADHGDEPKKIADWVRNKSPDGVRAMLSHGTMFVAERDGGIAAVGAISDRGEITLNYVAPDARFRGVSKGMLAALEIELKRLGIVEGRLQSTVTALGFYQSCGWALVDPQSEEDVANGLQMRKTL